jgi:hypothetical protein
MASNDWSKTTIFSEDNSNILPNQRSRIPTVPYGIIVDNNDTQDSINKKIKAIGDKREMMIDYSHGDLYIKNNDDVYNLNTKIAENIATNYGDSIFVNIDGNTTNLTNIVTELSRSQITSTPIVFMDNSNWVVNGKEIRISPDNKTTEVVHDVSDGSYKIQIKGYDPEDPSKLQNKVPYIDNSGVISWKSIEDIRLPGFEEAEENSVPVKSEDTVKWSKITVSDQDVNFVDIDTLETVVGIEVEESIVDNQVVYSDVVNGSNIICIGATAIDVKSLINSLEQVSNDLKQEKIIHSNDVFLLSSRITANAIGHSDIVVDNFDDSIGIIDISSNTNINYSVDDNTNLVLTLNDGYSLVDLTTISFDISNDINDILSVNVITDSDTIDLIYDTVTILLHKSDEDVWEKSEDKSDTLNDGNPINIPLSNTYDKFKVYISYSTSVIPLTIKNMAVSYTIV